MKKSFCILTTVLLAMSVSIEALGQESLRGQVIDEEGESFSGFVLSVVGHSTVDTLRIYSSDGSFILPETTDCPYHFTISYFGERVLDTLIVCGTPSPVTLHARTSKVLDELVVSGHRTIIHQTLMEDRVAVQGVPIFRDDNALEVLQKVPGLILRDQQMTYKGLPITYVRFGERSMRRKLSADLLQTLQSLFAGDVTSVTFKRMPRGDSYELIIDEAAFRGFETTASASYSRTRGHRGSLYDRSILNTTRMDNSLYLSLNPYSVRDGYTSDYTFDDGTTKHISSDDHNRSTYWTIEYAGNYRFSDVITGGLTTRYFGESTVIDRTSDVFGTSSDRHLSQPYSDVTLGAFLDLKKGPHDLHLETAYNSNYSGYHLSLEGSEDLTQKIRRRSRVPNASIDYSYTLPGSDFRLRSLTSYTYLDLHSEDELSDGPVQDQWEHSLVEDLYLTGKVGQLEMNGGVTLNYSHSPLNEYLYVDPHLLLGYALGEHRLTLKLDRYRRKPLAWMMSEMQQQETEGTITTGSSDLEPYSSYNLSLGYSWRNLGIDISGRKRTGWWDYRRSYEDGKFVSQMVNLGELKSLLVYIYYSHYWDHFYISPSFDFETGTYTPTDLGEKRDKETYSINLSMGVNYGPHKASLSGYYVPTYRYEQGWEEPNSSVSLRYSYTTQDRVWQFSAYADDIFDRANAHTHFYGQGFEEFNVPKYGRRQVGLSVVYRFSAGERVRGVSSLRHNDKRN